MKYWLLRLSFLVSLVLTERSSRASHLFGADIFYTHITGNLYSVNLTVYGDCSGSAAAFNGLYSATPEIEIYNNGAYNQSIYLNPLSTGVEVTPVCPAQINNTTCNGGTVPGIRKFEYSGTVNLSPSSNWLLRFTGEFMNNTVAGRSNSITNIIIPGGGSPMILEATLNNLSAPNSSPIYTTIPTPFFCINKPAQYNPGAVDPNNDPLTFSLVNGLTTGGAWVSYQTPFSATQPLATAPGSFSFSSATGQIDFNPNMAQNALVVEKAEEYRNGVLVGTSMREMTFVVLSNCNNNPPTGNITGATGATIVSSTTVRACIATPSISFVINPTDLDGDNISVSTAGLPTGAIVNITGNNTASPSISFSWASISIPAGSYTFFITYTDNGCPLSSKQTIAYTINITPRPTFTYQPVSVATCTKKAVYSLSSSGAAPFTLNVYQGSSNIQTSNNLGTNHTDSLQPGTYTLRITDANGCFRDTTITLAPPPPVTANYTIFAATCSNSSNGSVSAVPATGVAPFQFALGSGAFGSNPVFGNLLPGTYVYRIKDANDCIKDTSLTITAPAPIVAVPGLLTPVTCFGLSNGTFSVNASGGTAPYTYSLNGGPFGSGASYSGLPAGSYQVTVKDAANCTADTTITIIQPAALSATIAVTVPLCFGDSNGSVLLTGSGGVQPYTYAINSGNFTGSNLFLNLSAGTYTFHLKDFNGCLYDTIVNLTQPDQLQLSVTPAAVLCFGGQTGSITVSPSGGTPAYSYALSGGAVQSSPVLGNLGAGLHGVTVTDANGCVADTQVMISEPPLMEFAQVSITNPTCEGFADGVVTLTAFGGTPFYEFSSDGSSFTQGNSFTSLLEGTYQFYIRDINGCLIDTVITLTGYPAIMLDSIQLVQPSCFGVNDGAINVFASGGNQPLSYSLGNSSFVPAGNFAGLSSQQHLVTIADSKGCTTDTIIMLPAPQLLSVNILVTNNDCIGMDDNGMLRAEVSGGTAPYSFVWSTIPVQSDATAVALANGSYSVAVTDARGCRDSAKASVQYDNCCTVFVPSAFTPNQDGHNDKIRVLYKGDMKLQQFSIYNRFGQRVFYASGIDDHWDGTFNGELQDTGTYFYYLTVTCGNAGTRTEMYKGDITLVR